MSTRSEKERQKAQQEKFQAILSNLLKDDDNKYCVDCDAKGPRWASWNLGIFLCIRCAGIHRNLGVHISKVKSVNLDTWTPEQIANVMEIGNSRGRAIYEANLDDHYRRPQTDSALESFIRAKYETKKYIAKEWVAPKITVPKELLEDDRDKKKTKTKPTSSIQLASVPKSQTGSSQAAPSKPVESRPVQSTQSTVNTPQPVKAAPQASNSNTADLIGLVFAQPPTPSNSNDCDAPSTVQKNQGSLLGDLEDFMGAPQSTSSQPNQPTTNPVTNGTDSLENNFFGESSTSSEPKATTKDSIMALFGGQPSQQQFGVPAGTYMSQYEGAGGVTTTSFIPSSETTALYSYTDTGGMYMPQQQIPQQQIPQQQIPQQQIPQQQNMNAMYGMNNMPMQQPQMFSNQMGMMGTGMQQAPMGNMGMPQGAMMRPQGNMGMYTQQQQQPQMQPMQYQQMQQQMANMNLGQAGTMGMGGAGMMQNGIPAGQGWGGQPSGQTLSTNLWQ